MKKTLILTFAILWAGAAAAQHTHGSTKGPNGGVVQDVAGVHAELVVAGNTVTIHIIDENNKAAPANGFSARSCSSRAARAKPSSSPCPATTR